MHVYLDASALCKAFVVESGSDAVADLLDAEEPSSTSSMSLVEVASAINRLIREGALEASAGDPILSGLATRSIRLPAIVELSAEVASTAIGLLGRHPLKASDAVQLASAVTDSAALFVSSDRRLLEAAHAEGLKCFDPTDPGAPAESASASRGDDLG